MKRSSLSAVLSLGVLILSGCAVYVRDGPGFDRGHRRHVVGSTGPRLVLVAGTSIKYCPDEDEDVFFYSGRWYVFRSGVWLYGARHTGPWKSVGRGSLPQAFVHVPPGHFRHHKGSWHPARDHHPKLVKGGDDEGEEPGEKGRKRGHDKDGDGEDDHKNKKGKGHGKN